jgi:hypothetical protein
MKGVVFTEFLEMVEDRFSPEMADRIIEGAELASGGVYTTVGTYDHGEMIQLVSCLSEETGIPSAELVRSFGMHLFGRFHTMFPKYFEDVSSSFDFSNGSTTISMWRWASCTPMRNCPHSTATRPNPGACVSRTDPLARSPRSPRD